MFEKRWFFNLKSLLYLTDIKSNLSIRENIFQ